MFDGTVDKDTITGISASHKTEFSDIDGDDITERFTVDRGILMAIDGTGAEMWRYNPGGTELEGPRIISTGTGEKKVAVYEPGRGMLHLVGRNGVAVKGFPRVAGPWFNTGRVTNKSTWNLITAEEGTYIYNYELNSGSK